MQWWGTACTNSAYHSVRRFRSVELEASEAAQTFSGRQVWTGTDSPRALSSGTRRVSLTFSRMVSPSVPVVNSYSLTLVCLQQSIVAALKLLRDAFRAYSTLRRK